ncbi:cell division cycle protein 123 homolog [Anthonomus grandis grandis]|uniref:cell division cycle protein 123 homolog n=1 Tax=Anthonomus grandis grandis TaxID=2921223 RepID=UPI002165BFE0|nr:cell division cycle protein 123 homolog [Anthonomus grandis grandis]
MRETQDFKDFSIDNWYKEFKDVTIKTVILELSRDVLNCFSCTETLEDENLESNEAPFPQEFKDQVKNAFNTLGRIIFVKNNWHAPSDAKMFSFGNTLIAENIDDIKLYLTTSGIIQEDFSTVKGVTFCLCLRPWINIHPAAEFRCIVINNVLRGITPRDWPTYYSHFKEEGPQIIEKLLTFFATNIKDKFLRKNYVFDVVLSYPEKPFLLDFGALNCKTNLYAFSWKEISPLLNKEVPEEVAPVFRYLESDIGIMTKGAALQKFRLSE